MTHKTLARWQAISGLVFGVFLTLHLLNLMASVFGPGLYDAFALRVRPLYQQPLVEVGVLLTALVVHIVVGVLRIRARPPQRPGTTAWSRLPLRTRVHRVSAYFLLLVIVGHVSATRLPAVLADVAVDFTALSYTMQALPWLFYPYYIALGLCGLYHGGYGVHQALRTLGVGLPPIARLRPWLWVPLLIAAALVVLGVLSLGGLLYPVADPSDTDFARLAAEFGLK